MEFQGFSPGTGRDLAAVLAKLPYMGEVRSTKRDAVFRSHPFT